MIITGTEAGYLIDRTGGNRHKELSDTAGERKSDDYRGAYSPL